MSKYVVVGAPFSIQCNSDIRDYVYKHISPPFEELFDLAEEHVLTVLFDAWSTMLASDVVTFEKVCQTCKHIVLVGYFSYASHRDRNYSIFS